MCAYDWMCGYVGGLDDIANGVDSVTSSLSSSHATISEQLFPVFPNSIQEAPIGNWGPVITSVSLFILPTCTCTRICMSIGRLTA